MLKMKLFYLLLYDKAYFDLVVVKLFVYMLLVNDKSITCNKMSYK